ncbi:cyclic nucleotide-binding protein [Marinimicrobium koreense]|uniref:Cyclic nucleotide-binding protein n=1 Tax=Marinimicrobium koreense TaxID=306545 RepID=A0A3N1NVV8_9GAMM|nr:cyclic nucleotide-binding domain-containing protein [Marinimicrobium koreense]ROQ20009.1 cyclic nucleotide-binding protein [Marinimicrobium koreense]
MLSSQPQTPTTDPAFDLSLTRTLVPLKDMSESHLRDLLSHSQAEVVFAGQTLFRAGEYDRQHLYLLHGDILLTDRQGTQTRIKGRSTLMPLAHQQPRPVTAVAETDCSILRIDSERLDQLLTWSQVSDYLQLNVARERDLDEDIEWMTTVLRSNLFFKVPPLNVEQIFYRLKPRVVHTGETIIRQGEIGDCCYFIKEGEAEVHRHGEGGWVHLADIGPGRCFGEDALVNDAPRNARVRMLSDGVLMVLDKQDFYRLLKAPDVPTVPLATLPEARARGAVLVDTRSEEEYSAQHLSQAVNIPLSLLAIKSRLLAEDVEYLCYCDTGRRSRATAHLLRQQGYRAQALNDAPALFGDPQWAEQFEDPAPYVLKEGRACREPI